MHDFHECVLNFWDLGPPATSAPNAVPRYAAPGGFNKMTEFKLHLYLSLVIRQSPSESRRGKTAAPKLIPLVQQFCFEVARNTEARFAMDDLQKIKARVQESLSAANSPFNTQTSLAEPSTPSARV